MPILKGSHGPNDHGATLPTQNLVRVRATFELDGGGLVNAEGLVDGGLVRGEGGGFLSRLRVNSISIIHSSNLILGMEIVAPVKEHDKMRVSRTLENSLGAGGDVVDGILDVGQRESGCFLASLFWLLLASVACLNLQ